MKPRDARSVMASRVEGRDSRDFFPTPPWATRALIKYVLEPRYGLYTAWEPAAGEGHMAEVLNEYFTSVYTSDVVDYGKGYGVGSFVGDGAITCPFIPDWIITNPPYKLGEEFVIRALRQATIGVAMLARTAFIESESRYKLFKNGHFAIFAPFSGRVPMVKGRWDPKASSATSYSWFVWARETSHHPQVVMIPPEAKRLLSKQSDIERFAH